MPIQRYEYLQDYRRPFRSWSQMTYKEWPYVARPCFNVSELELFDLKWLIASRLIMVRLMSLWNVRSWF